MTDPDAPGDRGLRERLNDLQYEVTQCGGTERAFTGAYHDEKRPGSYRCICCDAVLFDSDQKYDSGSGWPSFWAARDEARLRLLTDDSHGMIRVEVRCGACDAHLGHVFDDGPLPTGKRYCINSAALDFVKR